MVEVTCVIDAIEFSISVDLTVAEPTNLGLKEAINKKLKTEWSKNLEVAKITIHSDSEDTLDDGATIDKTVEMYYAVLSHKKYVPLSLAPGSSSSGRVASTSASISAEGLAAEETHGVELTTLSYLPRRQITAYVGRISLHFVQEVHIDSLSKGPVGMGAFVFSFIAEVQALARAHTAARGGMALIALSIDQVQIIRDDRSQAYATISISDDVVRYAKAPEDVNVIN